MFVGFAVSAAVMIMAGTAYACTVYKGKITLTATGSSNTAVAQGANGVHAYCSGEVVHTVDMNASNAFNLALAPATAACGGASLPNDTYQVRWVNMTGSQVLQQPYVPLAYNCNSAATNVKVLGTLVTTGGTGTASGNFSNSMGGALGAPTPPNGASGAVNLCVAPAANSVNTESAPELMLWVI